MARRGAIEFEPVVEFPDSPINAARMYLGVMAYPERGAGQPGGLGVRFGEALGQYLIWDMRRAKGLRAVREEFADPEFRPPHLRDFKGAVERGRRRLRRRSAAFDIVGNQLINAFMNAGIEAHRLASAGRSGEAYAIHPDSKYAPIRQEIWERNTPTPRGIVRRDLSRWSERFGLNETGSPADREQKAKDLVSRGYTQSVAVLHMAHGLNQALADNEQLFEKYEKADWLLVLLWHAESWIWKAIDDAIAWRWATRWDRLNPLSPDQMIELVPPKKGA